MAAAISACVLVAVLAGILANAGACLRSMSEALSCNKCASYHLLIQAQLVKISPNVYSILLMASYTYRPLSSTDQEIRLLTVAPGQWDSDIVCELHHAPLNFQPEYEAL